MAEPLTSGAASGAAAAWGSAGILALAQLIDGGALAGAVAGASLFVMAKTELPPLKRLLYWSISALLGYFAGPEILDFIPAIEEPMVGSLIASITVVTFANKVMADFEKASLADLFNRIRGGKK